MHIMCIFSLQILIYFVSYHLLVKRYINTYHCFYLFQHQQQVAAAVERAKQVTMTELNAIIGVRLEKKYTLLHLGLWRGIFTHS